MSEIIHIISDFSDPATIRLVGSVQWFFAFFLSVVAGKLADSGYSHHVVISGSVLYALW